jgi:hypothetical protein
MTVPTAFLAVFVIVIGAILWWYDWRDRRDAKLKKQADPPTDPL